MAFERRLVKLAMNASDLQMESGTNPDDIIVHLLSGSVSTELPQEEFMNQALGFYSQFPEFVDDAFYEWDISPISATHPQARDVIQGLFDYLKLHDQFCSATIFTQFEVAWAAAQRPAPTTLPYALTIELSHGKPSAVCQPEDCHRVEVQTSFCTGPLIGGTKNQTLRINNIQNSRWSDINIQIRLPGLHKGY